MKILFIHKGSDPDYQCDAVLHGLKTLFGTGVEESQHAWYMYADALPEKKQQIYGKGFTLYGRLPANTRKLTPKSRLIDAFEALRLRYAGKYFRAGLREAETWPYFSARLLKRLQKRDFDYVVFGSVWRHDMYLEEVLAYYPPERVMFVDGEDHQNLRTELIGKGLYFKRELHKATAGVLPIQFGVPKELILPQMPEKTKDWATVIPGRKETYIFDDETDYYADYQTARYGITTRKSGWDCLRHYEILMNGCFAYFPDLADCPTDTMTFLPKDLILTNNQLIDNKQITLSQYKQTMQHLLNHTREYLSTEALAKRMLFL